MHLELPVKEGPEEHVCQHDPDHDREAEQGLQPFEDGRGVQAVIVDCHAERHEQDRGDKVAAPAQLEAVFKVQVGLVPANAPAELRQDLQETPYRNDEEQREEDGEARKYQIECVHGHLSFLF